ncbi:Carboxylesterase family-domain-containing protein [Immersiella caudata]|uniref:Carboxylesterase family-domain-containing protein n=1 Tax=Immersiella caudata TaxID=314043 RepID=A0AA39WS27_9PEZI|nr:Carboxylesterase family-domain-containing protein [Immersiella caudata]
MASFRAVSLTAAVFAISGAQALWLGGGLTILSNNQLDAAENDGSAAILVHQSAPFSAATYSCSLLGENPWDPSAASFNAALNSSLAYQTYLNNFPPSQLYWISRPSGTDNASPCRAVDATGKIHPDLSCLDELPTICTQSAPVSSRYTSNTSSAYQLTHYVSNTLLTGYRDLHTFKFRGVRFAPTPARFTYSSPSNFSTPSEALALDAGADCSQPVGEVRNGSSEDCLFANIWTPYLPPMGSKRKNLKPVMLYFYGGGGTSGSGKNPNTDGTNLASRGDVVSVSVNYRVGNLGFLNFNDGVHNGNYALSDMVSAIHWVNRYIEYFGGDPERVTIFGESAGAMAVHVLLGTAKVKGLFHRAIKQSSPDGYPSGGKVLRYQYYDSLEHNYETMTKSVLKAAGCSNATDAVACLGKLSGFEIVNLSPNANGIVVDGDYLTYHELVVNSTAASLATNVTVMTGVNRDEAGVNIDAEAYPASNTTLAAYFNAEVARQFSMPSNASSLMGLDKPANMSTFSGVPLGANNLLSADLTPAQILNTSVRIATDAVFTCYGLAKTYSAVKHNAFRSAYFYQFNRTYQTAGYTRPWCNAPKTDARPDGDPDGEYMKCHGGEQMVVFGTERRSNYTDRDGLDVPFMQLVVDYWASFARTGDPNPDKGYLQARGHWHTLNQVERTGRWEAVDAESPTMRLLQWNGGQIPFGEAEVCKALGAPLDVFETGEK